MTELGHHWDAKEGQTEYVKCHQCAVQREHVGEGVRHGLDATMAIAAFPDDRIGTPSGLG